MEASQAALKEGFTLYVYAGEGAVDSAVWPEAPLRTEDGQQLYYYSGDESPGDQNGAQVTNWVVYEPTGNEAPVPGSGSAENAASEGAAQEGGTPSATDQSAATAPDLAQGAPVASQADQPAPAGTQQPDPAHAPAAAAEEGVIVGDAGLGEQQPVAPGSGSQNVPAVGSTAPQAQSGVPLPEDRVAGVQPDPSVAGTVAPSGESVGDPAVATEQAAAGTPASAQAAAPSASSQSAADQEDQEAIDAEREALTDEEKALKEREAAERAAAEGA